MRILTLWDASEHFLPPAEVRQAQTPFGLTRLSLLPTGLLVPLPSTPGFTNKLCKNEVLR